MATETASRTTFLKNVLWGWTGVLINLVIGIVLSPIIIKKLGVEQYGIWVLLFSMIDYMRVLDFGFRSAVVQGCARCFAREDWEGVNRTVTTALGYFALIGAICLGAAIAFRGLLIDGAEVSAAYDADARTLIVLIALTVTCRLISSPFTATLEGFQRFDIANRAYIGALAFRSTISLALLLAGYGLIELAVVVLLAQIGESVYTYARVRRIVPSFRIAFDLVGRDTLSEMFHYGKYTAAIGAANLVAINAGPTVLGFARSATEVGYFALPFRLLMYAAEGLAKVADVTTSVTAEADERRNRDAIWTLAVQTNRFCFALFAPLAIFLLVYGTPLLRLWVSEAIAAASGPLIPIMLINFWFAVAGQYNAAGVLLGQGRHAAFAYGTVVEAVATIVLLLLVVPAFGVVGAAWVIAGTVVSVRGLYLAIVLCRVNGFSLRRYLAAIYMPGLLSALPIVLLAALLRRYVWSGDTWLELLLAGGVVVATYGALAFFSVLGDAHRQRIRRFVIRRGAAVA